MGKKVGKAIGATWSGKCNQKIFDQVKRSVADTLKTASIRAIENTIMNRIMSKWVTFAQTAVSPLERLRERYTKKKIINGVRLICT